MLASVTEINVEDGIAQRSVKGVSRRRAGGCAGARKRLACLTEATSGRPVGKCVIKWQAHTSHPLPLSYSLQPAYFAHLSMSLPLSAFAALGYSSSPV